jgi:hypothetical protein
VLGDGRLGHLLLQRGDESARRLLPDREQLEDAPAGRLAQGFEDRLH